MAGRPGGPRTFSGPSTGAMRFHNSSEICHIVGVTVLVFITSLLYSQREVYLIKTARSGFRTDSKEVTSEMRDERLILVGRSVTIC